MSCKKLKNIYIETTSSDFKVGSIAFRNIAENSTIYVRNDAIATQLNKKDGTYSKYDLETTTISNDYNWTAPTI